MSSEKGSIARQLQHLPQSLYHYLNTSLQVKLSLLLAMLLAIILLGAGYSVFQFVESIEQEGWAGRQREAAISAVHTIDDFLLRAEDVMKLVGALSVEQIQRSPDLLPELLNRSPAWIEIARVDANGQLIAQATRDRPIIGNLVTIPLANWFQQARAGQRYLGPLLITAESEPYIVMAVPAADGGVVAGRLRMNLIWETVATLRFGRLGTAFIVDEQGIIIAHPNQQVILTYTSMIDRPEFRDVPPDGRQRFYINIFGEETLGVSLNIPGTPWRLFSEVPENEATELSTRAGIVFTFSLIVFGLILLGTMNYLLHHIVFRILKQIEQGAERIGKGDLSHPLPVRPEREVAQVARAFNEMMRQLQERNAEIARQTASLQAEVQERRRVERELIGARDAAEAASRAKSTFLATMSHELRTPLTAIIGYSQLMEQLAAKGIYDTVASDASRIRAAGLHLLTLINDILDISKIEAGRMTVNAEYASVAELVRSAVDVVLPQMQKNRNRLQTHCPPDIGILHSDTTKVRQALINLLSNAAKFTEDGEVTLTVTRHQHNDRVWFRFEVADTGIGIPADKIDKLFKAFSQVDDSPTRRYGGTGLGLALSQRLCELIGGRITVQSVVGKGSVFTMEIPAELGNELPTPTLIETLAPASTAPNGAAPSPVEADASASNALVLVIDDDPTIGDLIRRLVPANDAYVITAETGSEGARIALDLIPDLIVLDLKLPDRHGLEVLADLRSKPELANTPIVVLTIDEQAQRGLTLDVAEYLVKPIEPQRLLTVVQRYCRRTDKGSQPLILVIEDDRDLAELVARTLRTAGWQTEVAFDGATGLSMALSRQPDLILLDYMLPQLDGLQLLTQLRSQPAGSAIPVIFMTARDLTSEERSYLATSANAILRKADLNIEQIVVHIRQIIQPLSTATPQQSDMNYQRSS
ncbi:response regulator [Chloroflexus sp.]|uniref:response regulator n=1 Tax=Chloroflexus sp. TaxID=1904827 RepID=UPI00260AB107|nr:response regulator [uncultured Chloroflexus sp.]